MRTSITPLMGGAFETGVVALEEARMTWHKGSPPGLFSRAAKAFDEAVRQGDKRGAVGAALARGLAGDSEGARRRLYECLDRTPECAAAYVALGTAVAGEQVLQRLLQLVEERLALLRAHPDVPGHADRRQVGPGEVERGDVFGYRGRSFPRDGHLVVVSGGTAHGIGLEAPKGDSGLRARAAVVARGGMDAMGLTRSPFWIDGKPRLFAEPPHMQASMLFLPRDAAAPAVGDLVDVRVRYTATAFDRIVVGGSGTGSGRAGS